MRANRIIDNLVNIFPNLKDRIVRHLRTLKTLKPNCIYVTPTKKNDVPPVESANVRKRHTKTPKNIIENAEEKDPITGWNWRIISFLFIYFLYNYSRNMLQVQVTLQT